MKLSLPIAALIAVVSAQNSTGYNITSTPFQLIVHGNLTGTINACDVGSKQPLRSLVSLCFYDNNGIVNDPKFPAPGPFNTFNFNSSSDAQAPSDGANSSASGILTWFQPVQNDRYPPIPHALYFQNGGFDGFGNDDATPLLQPDARGPSRIRPDLLAFDKQGELIVLGSGEGKKWFLCWHNFSGYQYNMLVYGVGKGKPENPPCVAVGGVKRIII